MRMQQKIFMKQNRLFTLMYLINSNEFGREQANIVLSIASAIINLIIFLSLPQIDVISNSTLSLKIIQTFIILGIEGLILLQILACYFYQGQYFIAIQWKIFRFILFPILTVLLFRQVFNPTNLSLYISLTLLTFHIIISLVLTATLTSQAYIYRKLLHRDMPINTYFMFLQLLVYILAATQHHQIKMCCVFMLLVSSFGLNKYFFQISKQLCLEYRVLSCVSFIYCWYSVILTVELFTAQTNTHQFVLLATPAIVYKIYLEMVRQKQLISYNGFVSIFQNPDTINFQQFIDSIQPIIEQILEYSQKDQNKDFVESMIISYYYQHAFRCLNLQCPFRNEDYKYQLKNIKDRKVLKEVLFKICKKIQFLFKGMYVSNPEHNELRLSLIQFYIFCYPNKVRALEIIAQLENSTLSFHQTYELFRVKIIIHQMESLQVVGQIKLDQQLMQFQSLVQTTLTQMMQFWSLFLQQKVDFEKVVQTSSKLFPCRKKIHEYYQAQKNEQTFSSLKILKIYSFFCLVIQKDEMKTWKINDYLQKLLQKLAQKKQIQYLTFESQIGLIALSLSESTLGKITMGNEQAASIFKYSKAELKSIRVNQIMPISFSQQHDNYLKVFLQNRFKKVNSDERLLYGKNKQGFIFPILLQLQRTISSTANQLLFIANIKKYKTASSPIACITDQQGFITDYSAPFKDLFLRQNIKSQSRLKTVRTLNGFKQIKNIQQVIPQFYAYDLEKQTANSKFIIKQSIRTYQGLLQLNFQITPIRFPLKQNGGYTIIGIISQPHISLAFPSISMSKSIDILVSRDMLSGMKTYYDVVHNRFQIAKVQGTMNAITEKQFTIPYINMSDMANIFQARQQEHKYGEDIKTLRLVKNHYERVQEPSQFQSQYQMQNKQIQTKVQILKINEEAKINSQPFFLNFIKVFVLALLLSSVCLSILLISEFQTYTEAGSKILSNGKLKLQNKAFVAQYVFLYTAIKSGQFDPIYQQKIVQSVQELVETTLLAEISEQSKQQILRIAYLKEQANLSVLLTQKTINVAYDKTDIMNILLDTWISVIVIFFCILLVSLSTYFLYSKQILSVYQAFMIMEQVSVKARYNDCKEVMLTVQKNCGNLHKQAKENSKDQTDNKQKKQEDQNDQNQQNPVKKRKRFKPDSLKYDKNLIIKTIFPIIFVMGICLGITCYMVNQNNSLFLQMRLHQKLYSVFPEASVRLIKVFLQNTYNYELNITDNYIFDYQQLENILFQFQQNFPDQVDKGYFSILLGNVCAYSKSQYHYGTVCNTYENGMLTKGLSATINFFSNTLANYKNNPSNQNIGERFSKLDALQYEYIQHILSYMTQQMYSQILSGFMSFKSTFKSLTIILLILSVLAYIYFTLYPVAMMEQTIIQTKDLINLIPKEDVSLNGNNKNQYAPIDNF